MKRCSKCGETEPASNYGAAKGTRDGLRGECKACLARRAARRYQSKKEEIKAYVKKWQQNNADRFNEQRRAYRQANPDKIREGHLKRRFGLTLDRYAALLDAQGGGCAICGRPEPEGASLHVDHDHETGAVRGLLCFRCNGGLGQFDEDIERLVDAIGYLDLASDEDSQIIRSRALALVGARRSGGGVESGN